MVGNDSIRLVISSLDLGFTDILAPHSSPQDARRPIATSAVNLWPSSFVFLSVGGCSLREAGGLVLRCDCAGGLLPATDELALIPSLKAVLSSFLIPCFFYLGMERPSLAQPSSINTYSFCQLMPEKSDGVLLNIAKFQWIFLVRGGRVIAISFIHIYCCSSQLQKY